MPSHPDFPPRERAEFLCDAAGSILSIRIRGEIDHHTATGIRKGIDTALFEKRPKKLLLDLSAVSFMDSSGLGLIMGRFSVMKELGGEMVVWNPSPETRSIMTLAGMEHLVRIEYPADTAPGGAASVRADSGGTSPRAAAVRREGQAKPRKRKKPAAGRTRASAPRPDGRKEKEA